MTTPRHKSTKGYLLGREAFVKISAVDGIYLTAAMEQDFLAFDQQGLSAEERRAAIAQKYGTAR